MKKYKLYTAEGLYKCKVNYQELIFLFGIAEALSVDEINDALKTNNYYIRDL